jgi:hypothetical protein
MENMGVTQDFSMLGLPKRNVTFANQIRARLESRRWRQSETHESGWV